VGRKAGLTDEKLSAVLGDDLAPFNDTERLVIELADALTATPSNVSDELYARLRNQFSEEQLMQLGGQIAFENYRARWNRLFNVESDNLYQGTRAS
jgi:alkylhydroperoxidase family enzyme